MISAIGMVRAQLLLGVKSHCRRDCGESGRPLCRAHDALAALDRVAGEERERLARLVDSGAIHHEGIGSPAAPTLRALAAIFRGLP